MQLMTGSQTKNNDINLIDLTKFLPHTNFHLIIEFK